jgi:hypothetical protein
MRVLIQELVESLILPHTFKVEVVKLPIVQTDDGFRRYERRDEIQNCLGGTVSIAVYEDYARIV